MRSIVIGTGGQIIPLEGKAEVNLKAKNLKVYSEKYEPLFSICASMADYYLDNGLVNLLLYAIGEIEAVGHGMDNHG